MNNEKINILKTTIEDLTKRINQLRGTGNPELYRAQFQRDVLRLQLHRIERKIP